MILLNRSPVFNTQISASAAKEVNPVVEAPDVSDLWKGDIPPMLAPHQHGTGLADNLPFLPGLWQGFIRNFANSFGYEPKLFYDSQPAEEIEDKFFILNY
jgi:hypothetical protein